jgi:hypothetical protein
LLKRGTLAPRDGHFVLSDAGRAELEALGIDVPAAGTRFAYPCLDWSERRDHLAGSLAVALLEHGMAQRWLRRAADGSRALKLTPTGAKALSAWIGA